MAQKTPPEKLKEIQFYLNQLPVLDQKDIAPHVGLTYKALSFLVRKYGLKRPEGKFKIYKKK